eukprot:TRINITY_DN20105_c0_g1_i1.p1 TRINITY_DN20105_c0_g1~~TRINITY_DN20105_c0_g1_i1.p1  ORF type:complete len:470 (-),score=103.09 TRINITY_DN20105_c0_g1_i1:109-1518(-)
MPRVGNKRKKKRSAKPVEISERELKRTPRCFVVKRGKVGDRIRDLVKDFRMVMSPNCAKSLRESKMNRIEDYIAVSGGFHVSHIVQFSATKLGTYMKVIKLPQGPTLTFKINSFTLVRDVRASQRRPHTGNRDYTSAPLQVLNGFSGGGGSEKEATERQLAAEMLRGLFPPIDVPSFNHAECRRTALFSFDKKKDVTYFRHFAVVRKQVGLQRGISKLLRRSRLPKLGQSQDIGDFILNGGVGASDSEGDEPQEAPIAGGGKVGLRLTEVGPRMELLLVKAEDGICNGSVLYHRYQTRTPSQIEVLAQKAAQRKKLKERNSKLSAMVQGKNAAKAKQKAERQKRKREAEDKEDEAGEDSDVGPEKLGKSGEGPSKKKRFHPLAYGRKASTGGSGGKERDKTVEINSGPDKRAGGKSSGGKRSREDGEGKGKGKGKRGAKGGARKGGRKSSGKGGAGQRVMDRFKKSARK